MRSTVLLYCNLDPAFADAMLLHVCIAFLVVQANADIMLQQREAHDAGCLIGGKSVGNGWSVRSVGHDGFVQVQSSEL